MDKEALRKQIYEELQSQYESRLGDAKKQKSQVEEELEASSEKWRSERRRLNAEIDRLEAALADSRESRRKTSDAKPAKATEVVDTSKLQAAADEKLKKATKDWETERSKLQNEVNRLQQSVTEALERANNPLRAGQAAREQLEMRLEEALKMRRHAEDVLLDSKAEWEKEKLKLAGEMVKARRSAGLKTSKSDTPIEDEEVLRLKKQLEEARAQVIAVRDGAGKEYAALIERERKEVAQERDKQSAQLEESRAKLTALEAQIATIREATAREYADKVEQERREAQQARKKLEDEIELLKGAQTVESQRADARIQQLEKQFADSTKLQKEIEILRGVQEADRERQAEQLEESRKAHARIQQLEKLLADSKATAAQAPDSTKLQKEIEILKGVQEADRERQAAQLEESRKAHTRIQQLEKQLADSKNSAAGNQTLERDLQNRTEELNRAQVEVQQLKRRLDETKDLVNAEAVEQLRRQYDERLQEMIQQKTQLSEKLNSASSLLEAERSRFAAAAASGQTPAAPQSETAIDSERISAEVARVEGLVAGIAQLIDDPSTELSIVIRKNVERAELDAYLKGILFSLGKNRGL